MLLTSLAILIRFILTSVDYPIPGNDDALRAISLYCDLVAASVLKGLESNLEQSGVDIGEAEDLVERKIIKEVATKDISIEEVLTEEVSTEQVLKK